ncbi:hypothetical protein YM304_29630 [Ilumatobacter coccineus YM16-304]|uniref:Uncharacterized protein n=1 Tax=Ilumatobacter coccineus (strain NBRC 103263 / KCTC 29153 / YM16-304) TaxID=1313172 RepID=A0A6C7E986_ILUCY|nr:hypothetical protein YM304_29630 [Ilumatobacter coccineus YM16-304]
MGGGSWIVLLSLVGTTLPDVPIGDVTPTPNEENRMDSLLGWPRPHCLCIGDGACRCCS